MKEIDKIVKQVLRDEKRKVNQFIKDTRLLDFTPLFLSLLKAEIEKYQRQELKEVDYFITSLDN